MKHFKNKSVNIAVNLSNYDIYLTNAQIFLFPS